MAQNGPDENLIQSHKRIQFCSLEHFPKRMKAQWVGIQREGSLGKYSPSIILRIAALVSLLHFAG